MTVGSNSQLFPQCLVLFLKRASQEVESVLEKLSFGVSVLGYLEGINKGKGNSN